MRGDAELSDADVVGKAMAGDRRVFETLVHRHGRIAYAVAFSQLRNHADAEDAAQEAFLTAFRDLHRLRQPARFRPWLVSIARHISLNQARRRQREAQWARGEPEPMSDLRDEIEGREREQLMQSQLHKLAPEYCEVLTLHYFAGLPTREISDALGISRESTKKRLQRARAALSAEEIKAALEPAAAQEDERRRRVMAAILALPVTREAAASASADSPATAGTFVQRATDAFLGLSPVAKALLALACGAAVVGVACWLAFGRTASTPRTSGQEAPSARQIQTAPETSPKAGAPDQQQDDATDATPGGTDADGDLGGAEAPLRGAPEPAPQGKG